LSQDLILTGALTLEATLCPWFLCRTFTSITTTTTTAAAAAAAAAAPAAVTVAACLKS
jgi:hypothetical protein